MRFGRYIVGLPSLDNETLLASKTREAQPQHKTENDHDVNGTEHSDAEAIV